MLNPALRPFSPETFEQGLGQRFRWWEHLRRGNDMPSSAVGLMLVIAFFTAAATVLIISYTPVWEDELARRVFWGLLYLITKPCYVYIVKEYYYKTALSVFGYESAPLASGITTYVKLVAHTAFDMIVAVLLFWGLAWVFDLFYSPTLRAFVSLPLSPADEYLILIWGVLLLSIRVVYLYVPHFVLFYGLSLPTAFRCSYIMTQAHYWRLHILYVVQGMMVLIGVILCGVGLLASLPAAYGIRYSVFEQYGLYQDQVEPSEKDVLDHLIP